MSDQREILDEYIKEYCDAGKILKAKYTEITLPVIKSTPALIVNDFQADSNQEE